MTELVVTSWLFGLFSGMRHAVEPDHVAAVSVLVAGRRGGRKASWLGACWGFGHAIALLGTGLALGWLRADLPSWLDNTLELAVAAMLIALGIRAVRHARYDLDAPVRSTAPAGKSFTVGFIHGLAGSGALVALVMSQFAGLTDRLVYVALFGLGSIAAMAALSGLAGWQMSRWSLSPHGRQRIVHATGLLSIIVGVLWAVPLLSNR